VDAVEPRISELLKAYPRMPSTVIGERIDRMDAVDPHLVATGR
jgi:hypothetical protein